MKTFSGPLLASKEGANSAGKFLSNVSSVQPDVAGLITQPAPRMNFSFAWNLFHARTFDFEITRHHTARKLRETHSASSSTKLTRQGSKTFVYARIYADLYFRKRKPRVMDPPVVAARIAKELWAILFERVDAWSNETTQNTSVFHECFRRAFFPGGNSNVVHQDDNTLVEWATALGTVVDAADKIKWTRQSLLASDAPVYEGRLCYLKWVSAMCNFTLPHGIMPSDIVNVPLRRMTDLVKRFKCPKNSPMTHITSCPL
ncbi:hypothetical protein HPB50_026843 [Hyalomma asiaticum]|uniref:Uncharacterized protein n=1 Tax=Hyalomma asiaticum TaxID=266040 RepID=A0ACB7S5Y8_HYAAI|nr:hypothetical protein HPB50_026843 [Hyalomma asiaticum]